MTTILALALGFAAPAVLAEAEYSPIDNDDQPGGLRLNPLVEIDDSREAIEAKILSGRSAAAPQRRSAAAPPRRRRPRPKTCSPPRSSRKRKGPTTWPWPRCSSCLPWTCPRADSSTR